MQRSIQALFYSDLLGFYSVFDLVEFAVISDGEIIPERTLLNHDLFLRLSIRAFSIRCDRFFSFEGRYLATYMISGSKPLKS
jgi:hypothetical protein